MATADVIDYKIIGSEMQLVEIELDPQESVVAEAGSMTYMKTDRSSNNLWRRL